MEEDVYKADRKCVICGITLKKSKKVSWKNYFKKRFCSHKCQGVFMRHFHIKRQYQKEYEKELQEKGIK